MADRMGIFITIGMTGIDAPVLSCLICGALVHFEFRGTHFAFHEQIAELEQANASA